jgi:hypothetical protein
MKWVKFTCRQQVPYSIHHHMFLGLAGKSPIERAHVDALADQTLDVFNRVIQAYFPHEDKRASVKKYLDATFPTDCSILDRQLRNPTGFFTGKVRFRL